VGEKVGHDGMKSPVQKGVEGDRKVGPKIPSPQVEDFRLQSV